MNKKSQESSILSANNYNVSNPNLLYAGMGIVFLQLFSLINSYQRNNIKVFSSMSMNRDNGTYPFGLDVILLIAFLFFVERTFAGQKIIVSRNFVKTQNLSLPGYDPLLTLRAFACFMVLAGHGIGFAFKSAQLVPAIKTGSVAWLLTSAPEGGVWMFFTLSGYLIGKGFFSKRYNIDRLGISNFYQNRMLRIIPVYWFALTVVSILTVPAIFALSNLPEFINILFFNMDGCYPFIPIGALWSISTEIQFYLAAPLLFVFINKYIANAKLLLFVLIGIVIAAIIYRAYVYLQGGLSLWYHFAYMPFFINFDLFIIGIATSKLVLKLKKKNAVLNYGLLWGLILVIILYFSISYLRCFGVIIKSQSAAVLFTVLGPSLTAFLTAAAIFCFEIAPKYYSGSLIYRLGKPTQYIGTLTYAIYSCHEPIFLAIKRSIHPPATIVDSAALFISAVFLVILVAAPIYVFIERPFEKRKINPLSQ